ncbi:MAG: hypothetical protein ABEJ73_11450, partial [Haloplanus sp.]
CPARGTNAPGSASLLKSDIACPHPAVRRVPWVETTASDEETFDPSIEPPGEARSVSSDVEEQLARLGYR